VGDTFRFCKGGTPYIIEHIDGSMIYFYSKESGTVGKANADKLPGLRKVK